MKTWTDVLVDLRNISHVFFKQWKGFWRIFCTVVETKFPQGFLTFFAYTLERKIEIMEMFLNRKSEEKRLGSDLSN